MKVKLSLIFLPDNGGVPYLNREDSLFYDPGADGLRHLLFIYFTKNLQRFFSVPACE